MSNCKSSPCYLFINGILCYLTNQLQTASLVEIASKRLSLARNVLFCVRRTFASIEQSLIVSTKIQRYKCTALTWTGCRIETTFHAGGVEYMLYSGVHTLFYVAIFL